MIPLAPPEARQERLLRDLLAVGNLVALLVARLFGARLVGLPLCPFHIVTGLYCPTCGMTRAYIALSRLELGAAMRENAMGVVFVALGLCIGVHQLVQRVAPRLALPPRLWSWLARLVALALLGNWVWLLVTK